MPFESWPACFGAHSVLVGDRNSGPIVIICNQHLAGKQLEHKSLAVSSSRWFGITTAVTGPPPTNYDFTTRFIGGSRSPLGSAVLSPSALAVGMLDTNTLAILSLTKNKSTAAALLAGELARTLLTDCGDARSVLVPHEFIDAKHGFPLEWA